MQTIVDRKGPDLGQYTRQLLARRPAPLYEAGSRHRTLSREEKRLVFWSLEEQEWIQQQLLQGVRPKQMQARFPERDLCAIRSKCKNIRKHGLQVRKKEWTEDEDTILIGMRKQGCKAWEIAERLNRKLNSVYSRIQVLREQRQQ